MILIGVGLVWFLANINVIPNFNPLALLNLWPLLLIALGLDLLIGRRSAVIGLLIGLGTVGAAILIMVAAPTLTSGPQLTTDRFTEPLGSTTSATIEINAASQPVTLHGLSDSANLFEGVIMHTGTMDFAVSGGADRHITLRNRGDGGFNFMTFATPSAKWDIGLNTKVPVALTYDGASGSNRLDLTGVQLTSLKVDGGSGSSDIILPAAEKAYSVEYKGGSGSLSLRLLPNADVTIQLDGGSGSLDLALPANAALHVEIKDNGSGSVSVGGGAARLSGKSNEDVGTWETPGFASAPHKITVVVNNVGSGSVSIH